MNEWKLKEVLINEAEHFKYWVYFCLLDIFATYIPRHFIDLTQEDVDWPRNLSKILTGVICHKVLWQIFKMAMKNFSIKCNHFMNII